MASISDDRSKILKAEVDRISSLPDDVLSLILSLLPTECAVRTSILSNRWKYLWTSITSLHFETPRSGSGYKKIVGFPKFVNHVFRSCSSSHIQKFSLHGVESYDYSDVTTWIDEAIKLNVNELDIRLSDCNLIFTRVFSCRTLKILTLTNFSNCDRNIVSFDLPCLRVLHIMGGGNYLNGFTEMLISSCPVLEDLILAGYTDYVKEYFMVSAPNLKTLHLQLSPNIWAPARVVGNKISVVASSIEYLHLSDHFIRHKLKGDFSSVVKACVNIEDISIRGYRGSYRPFQRDLPHRFTFSKFQHLKCLEVITCHDIFWSMLPKLIKNSPSLEFLSIKQHGDDKLLVPDDEYIWVGPKFVPTCLRFHLARIKIEGFKGRKHEVELVEYLLGNAKVLQRLTINCREVKQVEEMLFCEQLLKFSRASRGCHIQFQGRLISNL